METVIAMVIGYVLIAMLRGAVVGVWEDYRNQMREQAKCLTCDDSGYLPHPVDRGIAIGCPECNFGHPLS